MAIILLQHGLANRLRTIIGYMYVSLLTEKQFTFHWDTKDWACNGRFHDHFDIRPFVTNYVFETIDYMERPMRSIITTEKELKLIDCPKQNINYYFEGQDTIKTILVRELIDVMPDDIEKAKLLYKYIIPKKSLLQKANDFVKSIGEFSAVHIRRQDHVQLATKTKYTSLSEFEDFIKYQKTRRNVFMATDCYQVQQKFKNRTDVFCKLEPNVSIHRRPTSLSTAIIELLILSKAYKFKGTFYSSFSELVERWKNVRMLECYHNRQKLIKHL